MFLKLREENEISWFVVEHALGTDAVLKTSRWACLNKIITKKENYLNKAQEAVGMARKEIF